MEVIGSRFRDDGDLTDSAEFRRVVGHVDADFGHAFHVVHKRRYLRSIPAVTDGDAIHGSVGLIVAAAGKAAGGGGTRGLLDARGLADEGPKRARIERQGLDDLGCLIVADTSLFGFDHVHAAANFHHGFDGTDFEPDIDAPQLLRGDADVAPHVGLESRQFGAHHVRAFKELAERVVAALIGAGGMFVIAFDLRGRYGCADDYCAVGIGDQSSYGRKCRLRGCGGR